MHFHVTIVQLANTAMMVPRANSALQANTRTRQPNLRASRVLWDLSQRTTSNHALIVKLANTATTVPHANCVLRAHTRTRQPNHRARHVLWVLSQRRTTSNHVRLAKRHWMVANWLGVSKPVCVRTITSGTIVLVRPVRHAQWVTVSLHGTQNVLNVLQASIRMRPNKWTVKHAQRDLDPKQVQRSARCPVKSESISSTMCVFLAQKDSSVLVV